MPNVVLLKKAEKELSNIDHRYEDRILTALFVLKEEPYKGKKLIGVLSEFFSLKVWPYRIIYFLNEEKQEVVIAKISHRQGSYT